MKRMYRNIALSLLCVPVCIGCGNGDVVESTIEQHAYAQIEGLGDAAGDEQAFAEAFVAGAAPENRMDYSQRGYQIAEGASVDAESATVPVKIFSGVISTQQGDQPSSASSKQQVTDQVWTLKRVGDEWKIQDAPLG